MKNTKNLLITSIALATALFASVQVTAMGSGQRVNPYLNPQNKAALETEIRNWEQDLDPKNPNYRNLSAEDKEVAAATVKGYKEVYYGNKDYTTTEIHQIINAYVIPIRDKYRFSEEVARRVVNEIRSNPNRVYSEQDKQALINRYSQELLNEGRYANFNR